MGKENKTSVTEFILLGFSDNPHLQLFISGTVFLIFLISVLGNFMFLMLVCADPHLQKPMYFFLSNLSFIDIVTEYFLLSAMAYDRYVAICDPLRYTLIMNRRACVLLASMSWIFAFLNIGNSSVTLSTLLHSLMTGKSLISFSLCITQFYFFISFTVTENFLLSAMAYDRYVAICDPLRYTLIMNRKACILLASVSWIFAFLSMVLLAILISCVSFCKGNVINHFFCDFTALMKLSCSDVFYIEVVIFTEGVTLAIIPSILTLISYVFIISSILKTRSAKGKRKAFSTCSSHFTVICLFYGSLFGTYLRPSSTYSPGQDKLFSLLYTALIPMLNPIIYSLRNQDVKKAFTKVIAMNHIKDTSYYFPVMLLKIILLCKCYQIWKPFQPYYNG
ncbi:olfactory receptor 1019-like [Microcaecilia unicolor]|uniref:Olfactory receptor n=1 Tax=Microcaecilia unicolor TaxID=1415580 RepID=A0A6P7XCC7_9AMPH|nr:olfactory receptor 1019-like [Microcaecilia unicolor]